ncbi:MAG: D-cysteine desulfhydrase family protein [Bacteroidales bacterium]|nr:D-cysteine desulfhydrase family protein [Bacteroidales bacterium]
MKKSKKLFSTFKHIPRLNFSILPTPLHNLDNLSNKWDRNLYCKRDDMTGFAFGGNKTRKLDYLIKDALNKGYDSIVTFGSNQSNWCRMTGAAGSVSGMDVHLILAGLKPEKPTANIKLDLLCGARIIHLDTEEEHLLEEAALEHVEKLKKEGYKPYYLAVGGSNAIGALGYVNAFCEILEFSEKTGICFSKIIVATGSSGTQAGLIAGQLISGWEGSVIGMSVSRKREEQEEKVLQVVMDTCQLLNIQCKTDIAKKFTTVDDNYLGEGYRINTKDCEKAIELFAREEGIFLDEVYTGKAAAGLIDYLNKGKIRKSENVLFLHTGGNIQLFE